MHKEGHIGIGLLLYSPFLFIFFLFDFAEMGLLFGAIFIFLSFHPDIDMKIQRKTSFLRNDYLKNIIPFLENFLNLTKHRSITHTVWYALLWGIIVAIGSFMIFSPVNLLNIILFVSLGFIIGFLGIISHLLGDILTPMGIKPFYPVKNKNYSLNKFKAKNPFYNYGFLILGIVISSLIVFIGNYL